MNARMLSLINDSTASEAESPAFGGSAPSAVQTRAMLRARASRTSDHLPAGVVVQPDQQCTRSEDVYGDHDADEADEGNGNWTDMPPVHDPPC